VSDAATHREVGEASLEVRRIGGSGAETLVFLHEGLGSVSAWRDFPDRVAAATGLPALVYSRRGYGSSTALAAPRHARFMHDEAWDVLPRLLALEDVHRPFLVGHSDGATIALLYATRTTELAGVVAMAPHVFVEELTLRSIREAKVAYEEGELRARLLRHHGDNVDDAFWGWHRVWLSPEFRSFHIEAELAAVTAPVLAIQGRDDAYGTLAQLDALQRSLSGPLTVDLLDACGHAPHRDRPDATLGAIVDFVHRFRTRA
jgi:pimeloyl-ACP methyl ester carboxylesterase